MIVIKIHVTTRLITLHTRLDVVNNGSIIYPPPHARTHMFASCHHIGVPCHVVRIRPEDKISNEKAIRGNFIFYVLSETEVPE